MKISACTFSVEANQQGWMFQKNAANKALSFPYPRMGVSLQTAVWAQW